MLFAEPRPAVELPAKAYGPALSRRMAADRACFAAPDGGLVLDSEHQKLMISRSHAHLRFAEGAWKVVDLQSTNGLLVNGVKKGEATLRDGDTITFGGARGCAHEQRPGPKVR